MAKAEHVVPTGLSEKSKIYEVKKKEEELQAALEKARAEAQQKVSAARKEADRIREEAKAKASEAEKRAFEEAAKKADAEVTRISGSKDEKVGAVKKAAEKNRKAAVEAALTFLLSE